MRESEVVDVAEGKARMTTEAGRLRPGFQWDRQRGKKRVNHEQATLCFILFAATCENCKGPGRSNAIIV